ncbi:MAG: serine--tRNA ligase [Zetaproteobacteria bacterium CG12_big_fil_rev_8_21_14_0_65_55_1124]|nr:MAG: serine--tRNA ligase [Zetaproteobacteria bacterium CG1_02_55_237]PIS20460.1 MAG: serine--tRNA ligase [Zetaproteobacteria bacterium CG08_land_8_20_14_0_20_55_17]PIW43739.1 MAG: serine--tRNA ligase [Zetaproteobacteria bacterium CG12_big_fil_rev_8_21_14_0_65_55_1124]PIY53275.1 MAG: serine--tRNA ligase [Zetaproteobacteria bacterium CG_4_10_14_0_8_um_filter_55_43]PIZ40153.1 MAG: serine--tRNA ligase [Zetaproteobacteria bacterium CG_4_10_14_0_2_um_filter_55_20]PJB82157.1 MAG: serine--tRNA liga
MIDRKEFRRSFEAMQAALARRGADVVAADSPWGRARALDERQRELKTELEGLQAERNRVSKLIGQKKAQGEDAAAELAAMQQVAARTKALDGWAKEAEEAFSAVLLEIPNLLHPSVPDGNSEEDNIELRRWGDPRLDVVPPHWDIGTALGILDFEAGATLSGSRFTVLKGAAARLERGLMQFMLDLHADQHGYEEVWVPAIVNRKTMTGTGQLPKFAEDLYKLEDEDAFLIPTAEVPVTNLYQDKILESDVLPIRHCAYTPCFRREAGSAGRDERGMIRQHQFDKVELVHITTPERALTDLEELTAHAEAVLQALELPYRVVALCSADIGFSSEKTYDLEVWLPSQNCYREISSCSSFGQFQGRRAGIRWRAEDGKPQSVATLNGSGVAIGRCLVALLENGWQPDGSVLIPEALQPYVGGIRCIAAN